MIYERPTKLIMAETVAARSILREFSWLAAAIEPFLGLEGPE